MRMALVLVFGLVASAMAASAQDMRYFSIGSANINGSYYAAARAICATVNRRGAVLRCSAEPTQGSLYNLSALRDGQVEFALVQSDWHRSAYEGTDLFAQSRPMAELRSVMSLYPEAVTVLARRDAGIGAVRDLIGKRIDIGHRTSGRHATLNRLMATLGRTTSDFAEVTELVDATAIDALCDGRIDAVLLIVGHPNAAVARALQECDVTLAPFAGPQLMAAFEKSGEYVPTIIRAGTYPQIASGVPTYAVTATLVTRADVDDDLVQVVVARVLEDAGGLRSRFRLLASLDPARMRTVGLTAPLHEGAARAFAAFDAAQEKAAAEKATAPAN